MNRKTIYKISISIILGLIGFLINFFPPTFHLHPYTANFMLGFILPMAVALAWGWKYGLLSALTASQAIWFLSLSNTGWIPYINVPLFTLWIVWHGWSNKHIIKYKFIRNNIYLIEAPFRIFNIIILYTAFRWVLQFYPALWTPESNSNLLPLSIINFIAIKELISAYIVLLISDVLLNLKWIRKTLLLQERREYASTGYIITISILFGCVFWVFANVIDYFLFYKGQETFLDLLILNIEPYEMNMRIIFLFACFSGGFMISKILQKQRQSEERYRVLIERMRDGFGILDEKGLITYANDKLCEIWGFPRDKIIDHPVIKFLDEANQSIYQEQINRLGKGKKEPFEIVWTGKNRRKITTLLSLEIIFDNLGNPAGSFAVITDITARVSAEKALLDNEKKFRTLAEQSLIGIGILKEEKFIYANEALTELTGYSIDEIMGWDTGDFPGIIHHDDRKKVFTQFRKILAGESDVLPWYDYRFFTKSGITRWITMYVSRIKLEGIPQLMVSVMDITDRIRAKERIDHLNAVLRSIRSINKLVKEEKDRDKLLQSACDVLIENRGYYSAWIALIDETGSINANAEAGIGDEFRSLKEQLKRGELNDCIRIIMENSDFVITGDPKSTCVNCPIANQMYTSGGAMTARLKYGEKTYGIMVVSIPEDFTTDEEEHALFIEVVNEIAFALYSLELEMEYQNR